MAKVPVVMQLEALECGAASLTMILAYYGKWVPLEQVRAECGVSRDGANAKNIALAAQRYGFKVEGYRRTPATIREKGTFPCIIHWNFCHFVVLTGFRGNYACINDPAKGTVQVPMEDFDKAFTGVTINMVPGEHFEPSGKRKSTLEFAAKRLSGAKTAVIFVVMTSIISYVFKMINPVMTRVFLDRILSGTNSGWLGGFLWIMCGLAGVQLIAAWGQTVYSLKINGKMAIIGSSTYIWKVLRMPMEFFSLRMAGDIQQRQQQSETIAGTLINTLAPLVLNTLMMVFYLVIMLRYSLLLSLVGISTILLNLILSRVISEKRMNLTRIQMRDSGRLMGMTAAGIESIETIKASGAENGFFRKWAGYQASVNTQTIKFSRVQQYLGSIPQLLNSLSNYTVLILGVWLCMQGRFTLGGVMAFQGYMMKLYHHTALSSEEDRKKTEEVLDKILSAYLRPGFESAVKAEVRQMMRGDVPYVYTAAGTRALYSDGEKLCDEVFERSPKEHALETLRAMDEKDELFDLKLIERAVRQYPVKTGNGQKQAHSAPARTAEPLPREDALREAESLLETVYSLQVPSPEGRLFWGYINERDYSFKFMDTGLTNGLTGIGVFAAAILRVSEDERIRKMARRILREAALELRRGLAYIRFRNYDFDYAPQMGESDGTAGMLTGLELMRKYAPMKELEAFDAEVDELLVRTDYPRYGAPDRMVGMAGLLSALCRFERYRGKTEIIRKAADSLLAMKTMDSEGWKLWKTLPNARRPICGAGHGQAGVAEALYAAAALLGDGKYAAAGAEALQYERGMYEKYREKFGSWPDLRSDPPEGIMHGYCSGAPGTGILLERIRRNGFGGETIETLARYARESVDRLPLNVRDHLCCGNAAVVEYYLSVGDEAAAGRVLGAMADRRRREGEYRYMGYEYHNGMTPSLFYGMSGVGYEMLRYAFPAQIASVL